MNKHVVALIGVVMAAGTALLAQSGTIRLVPPTRQGVQFAQPWRPATGNGATKIIGSVIDIRQVPVARVKIQLRSLITGAVDKVGESDANGEYEFDLVDPGSYVVEMVLVDGYVVALSNAALGRFETMRTVVQLPGRWDSQLRAMIMPQNSASFLGMSAQTTMTAATMTMAANMNIAPVNSGEPVSATSQQQ
jgi:hypothetical protein